MEKKNVMSKRKWKWYNQLLFCLIDPFRKDVDYSVELKKRLSFSRFIRNQIILLFVLLLPVLALFIFPICCSNNALENDFYKVNLFDIVAAISTYIGTSALALIVWHSTWLQKREKENESAIRIHTEIGFNEDQTGCLTQSGDYSYVNILISNQNNNVPIRIKLINAFWLNKSSVQPMPLPRSVRYKFQQATDFVVESANLLSFRETETISVGFKSGSFSLPICIYLIFYITNTFGHKVYCIVNCRIDKSGWCCSPVEIDRLIDFYQFNRLKRKFGIDFIKEIMFYSPVGRNRKWINRIHLFKANRVLEKKKIAEDTEFSETGKSKI